jgi:hypothetical protein
LMWTVRLSWIWVVRDKRTIAYIYDEVAATVAAGSRGRSLGDPGSVIEIAPRARYCSGAFAIGPDGCTTDRDSVRAVNALC